MDREYILRAGPNRLTYEVAEEQEQRLLVTVARAVGEPNHVGCPST